MTIEVLGWFGSIMVAAAYALTVKAKNKYLAICNYLNVLGAALVGLNCYINQAFPSLMLNIVWIGIATLGIIENLKTTNTSKAKK